MSNVAVKDGPTTQPFGIGVLIVDPAIGEREALRRFLGLLDGVMQPGPANEAFLGCFSFRPFEHSAASEELAPLLAGITWAEVYRGLCQLELTPIRNCSPCGHCGSRDRYDVSGHVTGIACDQCGNIAATEAAR